MSRLDDGHSTTIEFAAEDSAGILFWEKEVTPPGMEGGGPNDTTTMRNLVYRTQSPKQLITMTDATLKVAYDAAVSDQIVAIINVNNLITITYPDGATLAFWGWLNTWAPDPLVEGEQPTATVTIHASNQNASGVETAPVLTGP